MSSRYEALVESLLISATVVFLSHTVPLCLLQLKGSMGLSIVSAVCSVVGIMLLITDTVINSLFIHNSSSGMVSIPLDQCSSELHLGYL